MGPFVIALGTYLLIRPAAYASAMARWMQHFQYASRMGVPTDGDPGAYLAFARFGGLMFIVMGVATVVWGP